MKVNEEFRTLEQIIPTDHRSAGAGVLNNYLDTLHSDYAFVITPEPYVKSLRLPETPAPIVEPDWDFIIYPNPSRDVIQLVLPNEAHLVLTIYDMQGRIVLQKRGIQGARHQITVDRLAPGAYPVLLTNGINSKMKKLIIY